MKALKQTFLTFQGADEKEAIYEVAVKLIGNKYVVTTTEDILQNGVPASSKTSAPPYSRREEDTLEKAVVFYKAYVSDLQQNRPEKGWVLVDLVEKIS
jgi:hypothetical protein